MGSRRWLAGLAMLAFVLPVVPSSSTLATSDLVAVDFNHIGDLGEGESLVRTGRLERVAGGDPLELTGNIEQTHTSAGGSISMVKTLSAIVTLRNSNPAADLVVLSASGTISEEFQFDVDCASSPADLRGWTTTASITGGRYSQPASALSGNLVLTGSGTLTRTYCDDSISTTTSVGDVSSFQGEHVFSSGISVAIGDAVAIEGAPGAGGALQFPVTLSAPAPPGGVSVTYGTADISAHAGTDYHVAAGVITFSQGETTKAVSVSINGDSLPEPDETMTVNLSAPVSAILGDAVAVGTILTDDFISFDWTVPERFGLDDNHDSLIDYRTTAPEVSPATWRVDFTYDLGGVCDPSLQPSLSIDGLPIAMSDPALIAVEPARCAISYAFALEGRYSVTVELRSASGVAAGQATNLVTVQDWLIVSLGDSVASGEGNPDIAGVPLWENRQCHRSASSGPAQAALAVERADSKTSVTFLHLACSGASVFEGILTRYRGQEQGAWIPPWLFEGSLSGYRGRQQGRWLAPQVDVMDALVGSREIDAVTVSTGANDVRFADVVTGCFRQSDCHLATTPNSMLDFFDGQLASLPDNYDALGRTLRLSRYDVVPERTYITEYYDALRDENGIFCDQVILEEGGQVPHLGISAAESEWASTDMMVRLNQQVAAGASRNGWEYVGGIYERFRNHGYCSQSRWIVQLTESLADQSNVDGTIHPNELGHALYGARLTESLMADFFVDGDLEQPRPPR